MRCIAYLERSRRVPACACAPARLSWKRLEWIEINNNNLHLIYKMYFTVYRQNPPSQKPPRQNPQDKTPQAKNPQHKNPQDKTPQ